MSTSKSACFASFKAARQLRGLQIPQTFLPENLLCDRHVPAARDAQDQNKPLCPSWSGKHTVARLLRDLVTFAMRGDSR